MEECGCDEVNICKEHFWDRYKETPQYEQQYGTAGYGWVGNCLGTVKVRYDGDDN